MASLNQEFPRSIEPIPALSHEEVLTSILQSKHPLQSIETFSARVPHFLSTSLSKELKIQTQDAEKRESAMSELVYYCLPQLQTLLQEHENTGIEKDELLSFGLQSLIECISDWNPDKITEESPTNGELRQIVLKRGRRMMHDFIAKHYGLTASRYELIPIYFQVKKEIEETTGKKTRLQDWPEIHSIIQTYAKKLPKAEQEQFQTLRYIPHTHLASNDSDTFFDALESIHKQYCSEDLSAEKDFSESDLLESMNDQSFKQAFELASTDLPPKAKKALELYYGLSNNQVHTLEEIAKILGCSHQYVHQLIGKSIRMLNHPIRSKFIKQFHSQ